MPVSSTPAHPVQSEAERQGLIIDIHTGTGAPSILRLSERLDQTKVRHPIPIVRPIKPLHSHLLNEFAFMRIMEGGVVEDFPKLRWLFSEIGAEWLTHKMRVLSRDIGTHQHYGYKARSYRRVFEEGRICITCEPDEDLPYLINQFGDDFLTVATDLPHEDRSTHHRPEDEFRERGDLSERTLEKLLWGNAARLFEMDAARIASALSPATSIER